MDILKCKCGKEFYGWQAKNVRLRLHHDSAYTEFECPACGQKYEARSEGNMITVDADGKEDYFKPESEGD